MLESNQEEKEHGEKNGGLLPKEEAAEAIFFTLCDLKHPEERLEAVNMALDMFFDQQPIVPSGHPARLADELVAKIAGKS